MRVGSDLGMVPLLEEQFANYVMRTLRLPNVPSMETRLYEDLVLDSLAVYELLVAIEELGVEVDEEQWVRAMTIEDCYRTYCSALPKTAQR
jgi:acyl carrier protein